ncbi:MAG: CBS domain-containing protein [bacterium]|nr:CBS domain-containing protein [bacterium]
MSPEIEEEMDVASVDLPPRLGPVLDKRAVHEPIRRLNPRSPLTVAPDASLAEAVRIMRERHVGCVLVVEAGSGRVIGILTERDLLLKLEAADLERPVHLLMTPNPETLSPDDPIVYCLHRMSVGDYRHVPLVDAAGRAVGIVSVKDIVHYLVSFFAGDVLTLPPDPVRDEGWLRRDGA